MTAFEDEPAFRIAGEKFNKSVEVFLYSTLNIQREPKLQACYNQLIETIYRIEFPSETSRRRSRSLSATCGWRWNDADCKLADDRRAMSNTDSSRQTLRPSQRGRGQRPAATPVDSTDRI